MSRPSAVRSLIAISTTPAAGPVARITVRNTSLKPAGFLVSSRTASRPSARTRSARPNAGANVSTPRATAAITVARIRGVLQRAGAAGRVGNPKRHRRPGKFCCDIRDEWIISVEDHDRLAGWSAIEDRAPAPGNDINLAIPVQLVTEKVGQHDGAGL